jgi:hypothetical protein
MAWEKSIAKTAKDWRRALKSRLFRDRQNRCHQKASCSEPNSSSGSEQQGFRPAGQDSLKRNSQSQPNRAAAVYALL